MNIFFSDEQDLPVDAHSLRGFAEAVMQAEGFEPDTELSVIMVGSEQMAEYNQKFMGRAGPTDVLAFPIEEMKPGQAPTRFTGDPPIVLGDVFLCPSEIEQRARAEGIAYDDFLHLLLVHGILHLMGYDHEEDTAADVMERREDELLGLIGRSIG